MSEEISWTADFSADSAKAVERVGSRTLHQHWKALAPVFGNIFLPPRVTADGSGARWAWTAPPNVSVTTEDLTEVRERLREAAAIWQSADQFISAGGDERARSRQEELRKKVSRVAEELASLRDHKLLGYVCHTGDGPRVHSWACATPAIPKVRLSENLSVSGKLFVGAEGAAGVEVVLENRKGVVVARTRSTESGDFMFSDGKPGGYRLRALSDKNDFPVNGIDVVLEDSSISGLRLQSATVAIDRGQQTRSESEISDPAKISSTRVDLPAGFPIESKRRNRKSPVLWIFSGAIISLLGLGLVWWLTPAGTSKIPAGGHVSSGTRSAAQGGTEMAGQFRPDRQSSQRSVGGISGVTALARDRKHSSPTPKGLQIANPNQTGPTANTPLSQQAGPGAPADNTRLDAAPSGSPAMPVIADGAKGNPFPKPAPHKLAEGGARDDGKGDPIAVEAEQKEKKTDLSNVGAAEDFPADNTAANESSPSAANSGRDDSHAGENATTHPPQVASTDAENSFAQTTDVLQQNIDKGPKQNPAAAPTDSAHSAPAGSIAEKAQHSSHHAPADAVATDPDLQSLSSTAASALVTAANSGVVRKNASGESAADSAHPDAAPQNPNAAARGSDKAEGVENDATEMPGISAKDSEFASSALRWSLPTWKIRLDRDVILPTILIASIEVPDVAALQRKAWEQKTQEIPANWGEPLPARLRLDASGVKSFREPLEWTGTPIQTCTVKGAVAELEFPEKPNPNRHEWKLRDRDGHPVARLTVTGNRCVLEMAAGVSSSFSVERPDANSRESQNGHWLPSDKTGNAAATGSGSRFQVIAFAGDGMPIVHVPMLHDQISGWTLIGDDMRVIGSGLSPGRAR